MIGTALVPLAGVAPIVAVPLLVAAQLLFSGGLQVFSINQISLRQAITPPHLLGRINATRRQLVFGMASIGALVGGLLGALLDLQATLALAVAIEVAAWAVIALSPLRTARE